MITREDLDRAFVQQREMTAVAIDGPGLESYMRNLGFDADALMSWTRDYAEHNIAAARPEWDHEDHVFVASLLSRAIAVGTILGRQTQP